MSFYGLYFGRAPLPYRYRQGPVPYIHKRGNRYGGCRRPQTLQENRDRAARHLDTAELEQSTKRLRYREKLPTNWDDIMREDQRSWKKHRKFQARGRG